MVAPTSKKSPTLLTPPPTTPPVVRAGVAAPRNVVLQVTESVGLLHKSSGSSVMACVTPIDEVDLIQSIHSALLSYLAAPSNTLCISASASASSSSSTAPKQEESGADAFFRSSCGPSMIGHSLEKVTPGQRYSIFIAPAAMGHASLPSACYAVVTAMLTTPSPSGVLRGVGGCIEEGDEVKGSSLTTSSSAPQLDSSFFEIYVTPDLSRQVDLLLMQAVDAQLDLEQREEQGGGTSPTTTTTDQEEGNGGVVTPAAITPSSLSPLTTLHRFTEAAQVNPAFVATIQTMLENQTAAMAQQLQHQQQEMDELKALLRSVTSPMDKDVDATAHGQHHFSYGSPVVVSAPTFGEGIEKKGASTDSASFNLPSPSSVDAWVEL